MQVSKYLVDTFLLTLLWYKKERYFDKIVFNQKTGIKGVSLMKIITEEMRFRQRLCEYALKNGVTKAARKYQTNRQFVYRQLKKYDGDVRSLALKSRRPKHSPNAHTQEELDLIRRMLKRNGVYGLAEVYVRCLSKGHTRSFGSMCRQIRCKGYRKPVIHRKSYTTYNRMDGESGT